MGGRRLHVVAWFCVGLLGPALLCGIGLLAFGVFSNDDEQITADSPDNVAPTECPSQSDESSQHKKPLPSDLESLENYTDDYTRAVALRTLLSSSDQQQVVSLLEQAKVIRPEDRRLSTQIEIFRRFAVIDPVTAMQHTFDIAWNRRAPIVNAIFLEWATADVDAAIAHAKTLGSADQRTALVALLRMRYDFSEDRIQELALEFGHESIGADVLEQIQIARAFNDPRSSWNALLDDARPDNLQFTSLATILELWVAREGFDVVHEAMESMVEMDIPYQVLDPILTPIAENDPRHAFELINEFSESARNTASFIIVGKWAKTDPAAAMETVSELDFRPTYVKDNLLQNISFAWAESAPYEAFRNLPKYLPSHYLQSMRGEALQYIVQESPQAAVEILNEVPNGVENLGGDLVEEWALVDARSALNWISSQDEPLQPMLLLKAMPALVETDPDLALSTALNQSIVEGQLGLEFEVIRTLARTDLHRATEMLGQVRDHDETKKRAYGELGRALVRHNDSSAAIEMGSDLPEPLQDDYFRDIINQIYNTDQVELFEIIDLLPKRKYQQEAARYLIWESGFGGRSHRYFTAEQLEKIRAFE